MLINVNRNVWNALPENVRIEYVLDCVYNALPEPDSDFEATIIADNVDSIINKNEKSIEKYGIEKYKAFDMPAVDLECGFRHSTGKYAVAAFDWSMDSDDNFDYSFIVYKSL